MIEVRSHYRRVQLQTPPPAGIASQELMVSPGTSDAKVLKAAEQLLEEAALTELREAIAAEQLLGPASRAERQEPPHSTG